MTKPQGKKVAIVLSGCGVFDGSEIYETVITLLRLDHHDAQVHCFAPNIEQMHVVNHLSGLVEESQSRNVLVEAARLARGEIKDLAEARAEDFDAIIVPGGFGAAKNLSDFAVNGLGLTLNSVFADFIQTAQKAGKPVGLLCIAPAMSVKLFGEGVLCTIGTDPETSAAINTMGGVHQACSVSDVCVDHDRKLVTTPAYMLANRIGEAAKGINKLVDTVLLLSGS